MILHAIYGEFDPDIYKVDTKVKVRIDAVSLNLNQTTLTNLADITLPGGKADVFAISESGNKVWTSLKDHELIKGEKTGYLETGYLAFPIKGKSFETTIDKFPSNVVVTVVEGNDFGDVIGKGAKLVGDKKDSITDKLKEWFGAN